MAQVFHKKKFSSYLGEQRAIDDIVMSFTEDILPSPTPTPPNPSPTPTPSITPTNTSTPTVTPTNTSTPTVTPTPTITQTPNALCPAEIIISNASNTTTFNNGTYSRLTSYSGGTFISAWGGPLSTNRVVVGTAPDGKDYATYLLVSGSTYYQYIYNEPLADWGVVVTTGDTWLNGGTFISALYIGASTSLTDGSLYYPATGNKGTFVTYYLSYPAICPSPTPTNTSTPTVTPTLTPSSTPAAFYGYIFPEPQDSTALIQLGDYMSSNGSTIFYGYGNSGVPSITSSYSDDLDIYAHYPNFINGGTPYYVTAVSTFRGAISQNAGIGNDSFGCPQTQYTFGTIQIDTTDINPNIQYFYSIWIPLAGVGGSMNNMSVDAGYGAPCSSNLFGGAMPEMAQAGPSGDVTVSSGAAIPAGTYRVLWINPNLLQPASPPANQALYIKGNHKF